MRLPLDKPPRLWSYQEAQRTTPYVRFLLGCLRDHFVACWHHHRLAHRDPTATASHDLAATHRRDGVAALEELQRLGVVPYQSPLRGIALFPFEVGVERQDGPNESRAAYWIYKDSREAIDSFAFTEELFDGELLAVEKPVPQGWKAAATGRVFLGLGGVQP